MYCRKCGSVVGETDIHCVNCGELIGAAPQPAPGGRPGPAVGPAPAAQRPYIPNYLGWSIASTVLSFLCCCCLPIGIVPLIFSLTVDRKVAIGDLEGAYSASRNAKLWCWITLALIAVSFILNLAFSLSALPRLRELMNSRGCYM